VLVLSEAVLVIVIDARDVGWTGMARDGDLTEAQRHGGFAGGGFSQSRKVAKGGGAGGGTTKYTNGTKKGGIGRTRTQALWYWYSAQRYSDCGAAVLGLQRSGTRIAAQRYSDRGGAGLGIWGECDWGECDWGEWLSGDGGGFVEGTL
jgi:hypothetical protein